MTTTINASTSSGLVVTPDNSGNILLQYNGVAAPAFSAYLGTNSSALSSATWTKVTFDTEEFDTNNNFAASRFTPTVAGYYQLNAGASPQAFSGNFFLPAIYKNGAIYKGGNNFAPNSAAGLTATVSSLVFFNGTTDYAEIYVIAGGTPVIFAGIATTYFNGCLLRGA